MSEEELMLERKAMYLNGQLLYVLDPYFLRCHKGAKLSDDDVVREKFLLVRRMCDEFFPKMTCETCRDFLHYGETIMLHGDIYRTWRVSKSVFELIKSTAAYNVSNRRLSDPKLYSLVLDLYERTKRAAELTFEDFLHKHLAYDERNEIEEREKAWYRKEGAK